MKAGAFVASFIAVGLIAYQEQPSFFHAEQTAQVSKLPSVIDLQRELLKHSQFATAKVSSTEHSVEIQFPVDSVFIADSTALKPDADRQFSELVGYLNTLDTDSRFEVSLMGYPDSGFNAKFRSTRARKLADSVKKAGVAEKRIEKVWQVLLDPPTTRDVASQAGLSASSDSLKSQYFSFRILTSK